MFYRFDADLNAVLLHESGEAVTRLPDVRATYPVNSDLSVQYEHASGIVLTVADAHHIGVWHEDAA